MNVDRLRELSDTWRLDSVVLRKRGALTLADALESVADELERTLADWLVEELTLDQAAEESGFSYSTLQQRKEIHVGTPGSPRIRRCDLPRKPGRSGPRLADGLPDIAGEILTSRLAGE